ncbi:MAG: large conductance mechanosensitive channel protein MscL [Clostridia bacterium]|nr:large conductance mechanosensitive channel protein MscL [Clostridia bacterium]
MKKFFKEFKEFISRGNIVDLSVAVIIGGAFSAIVTALTNQIIMPLVNWILALCGGKDGLESAYTILSAGYTDGKLDLAKSIYINWGAFISAIINFFIIALTLFLIVKISNDSKRRMDKFNSKLKTELSKDGRTLQKEIIKRAKEKKISLRKARKEILAERKAEEEAKKAQEEEDAKMAQEAADIAQKEADSKLSEQELLIEIRNLLKNK